MLVILLLKLLVGMFGATFSSVQKEATLEWRQQLARSIINLERVRISRANLQYRGQYAHQLEKVSSIVLSCINASTILEKVCPFKSPKRVGARFGDDGKYYHLLLHVRPFKWPEEDGDAHGFERGEALLRNSGTAGSGLANTKQHEPGEGAHGFERGESQLRKSWGTVVRMARMAETRVP